MKSKELRQKLGEQTHAMRELLDIAPEKRSAEQNAALDKIEKDISATEREIRMTEDQERRELALAEPARTPVDRLDPSTEEGKKKALEVRDTRIKEFRGRWNGTPRLDQASSILADVALGRVDHLKADLATPEYRDAFRRWLQAGFASLTPEERRAMSMGTNSQGGYTVPLEDFVMTLIKRLDEEMVIRGLSTKYTVAQAQSLGIPTIQTMPADADWTVELGTGNEDSTLAFGKREMRPNPLAKRIKVSEKLLRASPLGAESIVRDRLAYIVALAQSKAFNTGDGNNKPLGLYTADANGIPSTQDVSTVTSSALDPDKVIAAFFTLRPVYRARARWHLHPTFLGKIRQLKTSSPIAYLWQPGLALGQPSTILGQPYVEDEFAPSNTTPGAGVYAGLIGDFNYYHIVDALDVRIQRLDELYAETGQVGFIVRAETDAAPVLGEAFVRLLFN